MRERRQEPASASPALAGGAEPREPRPAASEVLLLFQMHELQEKQREATLAVTPLKVARLRGRYVSFQKERV